MAPSDFIDWVYAGSIRKRHLFNLKWTRFANILCRILNVRWLNFGAKVTVSRSAVAFRQSGTYTAPCMHQSVSFRSLHMHVEFPSAQIGWRMTKSTAWRKVGWLLRQEKLRKDTATPGFPPEADDVDPFASAWKCVDYSRAATSPERRLIERIQYS